MLVNAIVPSSSRVWTSAQLGMDEVCSHKNLCMKVPVLEPFMVKEKEKQYKSGMIYRSTKKTVEKDSF